MIDIDCCMCHKLILENEDITGSQLGGFVHYECAIQHTKTLGDSENANTR